MSTPDAPGLYVERRGDGGPPVVLLHGLGGSRFTYRFWVPPLARDHRVLAVDLKGFGAAPKPRDRRYTIHEQADLVHDLFLREDLREAILVGHSYGGAVAMAVALRLLDEGEGRLRALVVVAGAVLPQRLPRHLALGRIPLLGALFTHLVPARLLVREGLKIAVHDPASITPEQVEGYAAPLRTPGARHALRWTLHHLVPEDVPAFVARYPEVDVPALLLWGEHDRVVPPEIGRRLRLLLPRARLVVLPGIGHIPPEEAPEESLAVLRDFLREVYGRGGGAGDRAPGPGSGGEPERPGTGAGGAQASGPP